MRHSRKAERRGGPAALAAILGAVVLLGGLAGSAVAQSASPAAGALKIVTTTTVFADIVRNIARGHADVTSIIPAGVGPEDYEPKPEDALLLADADLIVSNGVGLDDFLGDLLQSGTGGATAQLVLGEGIPTLTIDGEQNPHFWLDPSLVVQYYVPAIIAALSTIDPAHGADYGTSALAFVVAIDELDAGLREIVATIPEANRKLVTFHDAFPYLAQHYGFELVGVILENAGAEPSAGELAKLVETVKAAGVNAIFSESQFNPELAQTLAEEAGITQMVTNLYNDALGDPPADSYLGLMQYDIEQIANALR
jgi:ABC-type Zn uptake system ZnuABC Zn-binding protein ZnuA